MAVSLTAVPLLLLPLCAVQLLTASAVWFELGFEGFDGFDGFDGFVFPGGKSPPLQGTSSGLPVALLLLGFVPGVVLPGVLVFGQELSLFWQITVTLAYAAVRWI